MKTKKPSTRTRAAKAAPMVKPLSNSMTPEQVQNELNNQVRNGLTEAIMGFSPGGTGPQIQGVETLFLNNRWYLISNMRQICSETYVEHGVIKTLVDVPVDDGFRGGVKVKTKQLEEEQIVDLMASIERDDDLTKVAQALKWNRLFGGAGIVVLTDQDPSTPLEINNIGKDTPLEFRAVDMWELFYTKQNTSDYAQVIDSQELINVEFYDYYGVKLHHSRVMSLRGFEAPSFIRPRLRGWGLSVLEVVVRSVNQYLKSTGLCFEVLDEFKIDVFKIKNLAQTLMSPNGTAKARARIQLANQEKNYLNAITMDSEDDYIQKELTFTGLAEVMQGIRMQIACDVRMPLTKLFGVSASGFSSGEDDIENYNGMVESEIRSKSKHHIITLVSLKCQKMFGFVPDDLTIEFRPLRELSAEQEEAVKTAKFARVLQAVQAGLITTKDFYESCNRDQLLPVQLDTSDAEAIDDELEAGDEATDEKPKAAAGASDGKSGMTAKTAPSVKNSAMKHREEFEMLKPEERYSYAKIQNPGKVDETLWKKAKEVSKESYGEERWPFVTWLYKKEGGKFT